MMMVQLQALSKKSDLLVKPDGSTGQFGQTLAGYTWAIGPGMARHPSKQGT